MDDTGRDNETWLMQLRSDGAVQQGALSDLRAALLISLRGALSKPAAMDASFLEDAVQDSLIRILGRLEQFEGRSQFLTWATSITIRVAMSELRRRRWKDVSLDEVLADSKAAPEATIDDLSGPDAGWDRKAILDRMYTLILNDLTEKQRSVLLAELRGMPQDEIARYLGSNRNAVYKLTHDARKRLKRGLEAAGYQGADVEAAFAR